MSADYGLNDDWLSVQKTLEEIIPVYDRTNRYISLGKDLKLRKAGTDLLKRSVGKEKFSILDLGSGTGRMSLSLLDSVPEEEYSILLLDPIENMMKVALKRLRADGVIAIFENLPFRKGTFNSAMAGFSLRDARNLKIALSEINSILDEKGLFLIVDLSKPDSRLNSWFLGVYWRIFAPFIAFLAEGSQGLKFADLAKTFRRLPTVSEFSKLVGECGFEVKDSSYYMLGGAAIVLLAKKFSAVR